MAEPTGGAAPVADGRGADRVELEAILQTALVGIAFNRSQPPPRHFVRCNPAFEAMFGWAPGELIGRPTSLLWPDAQAYAAVLRIAEAPLRRGEAVAFEDRLVRRDGSRFDCLVRAKMVSRGSGLPEGTVMILEDMSLAKAQQEALALAMRQAQAANQAKSDFVANLAHEIRNPLGAVLGLAHLALDSPDEAERQQHLRQLLSSAQMLKDLLDSTLDLSKIEAGMLSIVQRPFAVDALFDELAAAWRPVAKGQGRSLLTRVDPAVPAQLTGDPLRIRQILSNFVSNALKYAERGPVTLVCRAVAPGIWRFEVHDQGPGLDDAQRDRLFQRFVQLGDAATAARRGGTGLGLSICRDLALRMGGEAGVDSVPGQGACFWLRLALPSVAQPRPPAPAAALRPPERPLSGLRVLVVEDDAVNQLVTRSFIERWGGEVDVASDGDEALQRLRVAAASGRPHHVVLMDLHMPGHGGIETTRLVRAEPALGGVVIMGLSAAAQPQEVLDAIAAGMQEVVGKPFDPAELCGRLARLVPSA
ncbi:MAG: response regulator [Burkholderiales bacterium]|nr:response regulator [Burkholderiales bacterium]